MSLACPAASPSVSFSLLWKVCEKDPSLGEWVGRGGHPGEGKDGREMWCHRKEENRGRMTVEEEGGMLKQLGGAGGQK